MPRFSVDVRLKARSLTLNEEVAFYCFGYQSVTFDKVLIV